MERENEVRPTLSHVEPVLAVKDVLETILYWHHVLGFPQKWTWGEPVNHGGVSWNGVHVQFSKDPTPASVSGGNSLFIRVRNLKALYDFHMKKNVHLVEPLENKPWGMAGYTVKEINGYYLIFAGAPIAARDKSTSTFPDTIRIVERKPDSREYLSLVNAVGWGKYNDAGGVENILAAPLFAVVAEDSTSKEVVGCALLLGDNASFFYVKDVMVRPDYQNKYVGSAMMQRLTDWLDDRAPNNAFIVLITPENLSPFYQQFGFTPAFGMVRRIDKTE